MSMIFSVQNVVKAINTKQKQMSDTYLPVINRYKTKHIISTDIVEIMNKYSKWLKDVLPTIVQSTMTTTSDGKIFLLITYKQ